MQVLKMQLNTLPAFTRDIKVTLTNPVSGEKREVKPYLDGSVVVPQLPHGQWRVQVAHPNLVFDVFDRNIQVIKDRPTFTPIIIPPGIFDNVRPRDTPEADLGPVQQKLDELAGSAERQARKMGGQPIYADDWNELAFTAGEISRSTRELTELVAPAGHHHPEIEKKIEEIQSSIQRFFDAFGSAIAQIQRQIQQLALQRKVESALEKVPGATLETRKELENAVVQLGNSWQESPGVYSAQQLRVAQKVQVKLAELLTDADPVVREDPAILDLCDFTDALATGTTVTTYAQEVAQQQRANMKTSRGIVSDALQAGRIGSF